MSSRSPAAPAVAALHYALSGEVWRSTSQLRTETGLGESTIRRQLATLRERGELEETITFSAKAIGHQTRVYRLTPAARLNGARPDDDFFPTPPAVVADMLAEFRPKIEIRSILEPCAGAGAMLAPLRSRFPGALVDAFDLHPRAPGIRDAEFLTYWKGRRQRYDLVITNPPYNDARQIVQAALGRVKPNGYAAMLLRDGFLHSQARDAFLTEFCPWEVWHLIDRPEFIRGKSKGAAFTDYCWVIWRMDGRRRTSWKGRRI